MLMDPASRSRKFASTGGVESVVVLSNTMRKWLDSRMLGQVFSIVMNSAGVARAWSRLRKEAVN